MQIFTETIPRFLEGINSKIFIAETMPIKVVNSSIICGLFESLYHGFPYQLTLWEANGKQIEKDKIKKLKIPNQSNNEYEFETTAADPKKKYLLVIDGKFRLSMLYWVLEGNFIIKNQKSDLYLNILNGKPEFRFFGSNEQEDFITTMESDKIKEVWFKVKSIYNIIDLEIVGKILHEKFDKDFRISISEKQIESVAKLLSTLRFDRVILNKVLSGSIEMLNDISHRISEQF